MFILGSFALSDALPEIRTRQSTPGNSLIMHFVHVGYTESVGFSTQRPATNSSLPTGRLTTSPLIERGM